jgi:hypothetical protein
MPITTFAFATAPFAAALNTLNDVPIIIDTHDHQLSNKKALVPVFAHRRHRRQLQVPWAHFQRVRCPRDDLQLHHPPNDSLPRSKVHCTEDVFPGLAIRKTHLVLPCTREGLLVLQCVLHGWRGGGRALL